MGADRHGDEASSDGQRLQRASCDGTAHGIRQNSAHGPAATPIRTPRVQSEHGVVICTEREREMLYRPRLSSLCAHTAPIVLFLCFFVSFPPSRSLSLTGV